MNRDQIARSPVILLSARGAVLDGESEFDLGVDADGAQEFLAIVLSMAQTNDALEVRFDSSTSVGCLLVREDDGWLELLPPPDEVRRPYYRWLARRLFGPLRNMVVWIVGGFWRYEPTVLCRVEHEVETCDWQACLKPNAIWFERIAK